MADEWKPHRTTSNTVFSSFCATFHRFLKEIGETTTPGGFEGDSIPSATSRWKNSGYQTRSSRIEGYIRHATGEPLPETQPAAHLLNWWTERPMLRELRRERLTTGSRREGHSQALDNKNPAYQRRACHRTRTTLNWSLGEYGNSSCVLESAIGIPPWKSRGRLLRRKQQLASQGCSCFWTDSRK